MQLLIQLCRFTLLYLCPTQHISYLVIYDSCSRQRPLLDVQQRIDHWTSLLMCYYNAALRSYCAAGFSWKLVFRNFQYNSSMSPLNCLCVGFYQMGEGIYQHEVSCTKISMCQVAPIGQKKGWC